MEAFVRARGIAVPERALRWSGAELFDLVRREAAHLEAELLAIPVAHERRAMADATLVPFARETVAAMKGLGFATAIWTNNDRVVADFVLARFELSPHFDLIVTRDEMRRLKPDPDGLRVVRERWPDAEQIVVVGGRPRRRRALHRLPPGPGRDGAARGRDRGGDPLAARPPRGARLRPPHPALSPTKRGSTERVTSHPTLSPSGRG
jgi:hypothetical protein